MCVVLRVQRPSVTTLYARNYNRFVPARYSRHFNLKEKGAWRGGGGGSFSSFFSAFPISFHFEIVMSSFFPT